MLALAAVGLATSLGNLLRLAAVGGAGMAVRSLADRTLGAVVATESAPRVVVRCSDGWTVEIGVWGVV